MKHLLDVRQLLQPLKTKHLEGIPFETAGLDRFQVEDGSGGWEDFMVEDGQGGFVYYEVKESL